MQRNKKFTRKSADKKPRNPAMLAHSNTTTDQERKRREEEDDEIATDSSQEFANFSTARRLTARIAVNNPAPRRYVPPPPIEPAVEIEVEAFNAADDEIIEPGWLVFFPVFSDFEILSIYIFAMQKIDIAAGDDEKSLPDVDEQLHLGLIQSIDFIHGSYQVNVYAARNGVRVNRLDRCDDVTGLIAAGSVALGDYSSSVDHDSPVLPVPTPSEASLMVARFSEERKRREWFAGEAVFHTEHYASLDDLQCAFYNCLKRIVAVEELPTNKRVLAFKFQYGNRSCVWLMSAAYAVVLLLQTTKFCSNVCKFFDLAIMNNNSGVVVSGDTAFVHACNTRGVDDVIKSRVYHHIFAFDPAQV